MSADELRKIIEGDLQSIEKLCSATWEPLYRFIYYKVQNREEAEEITQETYVKTLTYLQKHGTIPENFPGFLNTVALNILRDRWRLNKRRGIPVNFDEINPREAADPDYQNSITERIQIENALSRMKEDQRTVLDLRIIKGYSVAETARLTGKTRGAVRTLQYRALQALSKIVDDSD